MLTIIENKGKIKGLKIAFVGACNNNVARSLIEACLMLGGNYIGIGPKSVFPDKEELNFYQSLAKKNGGSVEFSEDTSKLKGVDVVYQDVFLDLGESEDL
jgi:ornithine carbamoyltransferase